MAIRPIFASAVLLLLTACASTQPPVIYKPEQTSSTPLPASAGDSRASIDAEFAAQLREQERLAAEEKAKAEAAKADADRRASHEAQTRREATSRAEPQDRARQSATGSAGTGAGGARSAAPATDKKAAEIAKQQARIAELRKKIAANKAETSKLDSANTSLKQAITAAESLNKTLSAEQQKYKDSDPKTGKTQEPLAKSRIDELTAEVERLQKEAATLTAKPGK